ncbi:phosphatase PAP2 family protein [Gynurincola endophyticus]|uniref:phosphatase PAP2 family protein n=1 Tax=Gynurincola endophyticus TaxID=2479004 RepID=UPI000F8D264D|nr:phosphatase PAP2 family protein [Gynurincola endophyticus]
MRQLLILFILIIFFLPTVQSQHIKTDSINKFNNSTERLYTYDLNLAYLKTYPSALWYTTSSPARWKQNDFIKAGITIGVIGTTMLADDHIRSWVQKNRNSTIDDIFNTVEPFGNRYSPYVLIGMYGVSKLLKDERLQHTTLLATRSFIISTAHYVTLKAFVRRLRPDVAHNQFTFAAPFTVDYTSFPSGHTNTVFSIATTYALEYKDKKWVPWVAYGIASLTGASRIVQNRHWASDVLAGAVIGHFTAKAQYAWERKNNRKKQVVTSLF